MAKSRLVFPFSFLLSSARCVESPTFRSASHIRQTQRLAQTRRTFRMTANYQRAAETTTGQRYGTANAPPPHLSSTQPPAKSSGSKTPAKQSNASQAEKEKPASADTKQAGPGALDLPVAETALAQKQPSPADTPEIDDGPTTEVQDNDTIRITDIPYKGQAPSGDNASVKSPEQPALKTILSWESPMSDQAEKPPHLEPPPYIHHFDTFTLVRNLEEGGFSEGESVILMKSVRAILADNMDLARDGLVSKGDAEMTAYLFSAACSELRTEIKHTRSSTSERMQSERNNLQHGVDVLAQRITAETASLKDELKGMFDDRKMAVRIDRRDIENRVQELNYKITTELNSEMKSEVEGLRWVLVRRTAISIAIVTLTALLTLKISNTAEKRKEESEAAHAANAAASTSYGGSSASLSHN